MLRRVELKGSWRCLDPGSWPADLPLGRRTVIYGHNGSGKSTLSDLLLGLADGSNETVVTWEDETGRRTTVGPGGACPSPFMSVFTRRWVDANLSEFLDGRSASAIVTLGQAAIDAKEEEDRLAGELKKLSTDASDAEARRKSEAKMVSTLTKGVQERIVAELREFDYEHFTKHRYSVTKVAGMLRDHDGDVPDAQAHAHALKHLCEGVPDLIPEVAPAPTPAVDLVREALTLLAETPTRVALAALEGDAAAQRWAEEGLALHDQRNACLFCAGPVSSARRQDLANHFDESWLDIRSRAQRLRNSVSAAADNLLRWCGSLPEAARLTDDLRQGYDEGQKFAAQEVDKRSRVLQAVADALQSKVDDPTETPEAPDTEVLGRAVTTADLTNAVLAHNARVNRHAEVTEGRIAIVIGHIIGSQARDLRDLDAKVSDAETKRDALRENARKIEHRLDEIRQQQFTTVRMAETLTEDLARVYGKSHLSVIVTDDGKSYACLRSDGAATHLSEGERTTLSLLYFLRKLQDEQVPGIDPSQRIVVIDDPSSSLDREALFATHQWLFDTLKGFGQSIVLTHDFSLLRLFIKSHNSAWGKSTKRIAEKDVAEARFPKVSFLEMFTTSNDIDRCSRIGPLPRVLLNHTTEYAYLFYMVMAGVAASEDHERLFLLPNAARRVLEVFASYKAPHRTDFMQQLESLVGTEPTAPFRDVYDFCNRYSHGEGSESVDVLDARAVHGQIRRCMELLKAVDEEHFERMCSAAQVDPAVLG